MGEFMKKVITVIMCFCPDKIGAESIDCQQPSVPLLIAMNIQSAVSSVSLSIAKTQQRNIILAIEMIRSKANSSTQTASRWSSQLTRHRTVRLETVGTYF